MKFSCTQENLAKALLAVSRVVGKNLNLPILANVLIKIADKQISLITTNLEIAVTASVRGKVDAAGEVTVPARLFADYVTSLPKEERVDIELKAGSLEIKTGSSKTKIKTVAASEFPLIPQVSGGNTYRATAEDLRSAVAAVIFSASPNEARPELTGLLMRFSSSGPATGSVTLAATDSYRLAEAVVPLHEGSATGEKAVIVPARTMGELQRILGGLRDDADLPETVEITLADNQLLFRYGPIEMVSRTIEGNYPDYRAVIPETSRTSAVVDRAALTSAVRTAALFSRSGLYDVHVSADPASGLTIASADNQTGENETTVPAKIEGTANKVTLNYRYLVDGLNAINSEEVSLRLIDAANPCLLLPQSNAVGKTYRYIVMPIKQ